MKQNKVLVLAVLVATYLALLSLYVVGVFWFWKDPEKAGQFGDMFGCFTAFVNGLALFGVAYTVYQQLIQLRIQNSSHVVATLDIFHKRWVDPQMLRVRRRACERFLQEKGDGKFSQSMQYVAETFEHMGTLVKLQTIDSHVIWQLYSWYVEHYWCMFKKHIENVRQKAKDNSAFSEFDSLYKMMMEITSKKGLPDFGPSIEELSEFARSEMKLADRLLSHFSAAGTAADSALIPNADSSGTESALPSSRVTK